MEITVSGKPRATITVRDERAVETRHAASSVEGRVLPAEEATRAYRGEIRRTYGIMGAVGITLGLATFAGGLPVAQIQDRIAVVLTGTALGGVAVVFALWRYNRALTVWNGRLAERLAALPPAGTPVQLDGDGLRVGARAVPWRELSLAAIALTDLSSDDTHLLKVDRLVLTSAGRPITLDRHLMRNGAAIVQTAYCKLVRERGMKEF